MDISGFARPLTINPQSQPHKQTIILLHGRGSNSTEFGPALLFKPLRAHRSRLHVNGGGGGSGGNSSNGNGSSNRSSNNSKSNGNGRNIYNTSNSSPAAAFYHRRGSSITLRDALPHAKFIFPTAVSLHAKALDGCAVNQWFDNWPLAAMVAAWNSGTSSSSYSSSESSQKDKDNDTLPIPGLQQTVRFLHDLIQTEIDELGGDAGGVVIGGFSQGSAASLIAALLWEGESLGAWVGMSGWMPFSRQIQQAAAEDEAAAAADPNIALRRGVDKLRNILDFPVSSSAGDELDSRREVQIPIEHTPLFMAHGLKDDKAPIILGRMVRSCLESLHLDLQYKEYEHGEHECSEETLCDLVSFLWEKLRL